MTKRIWGDLWPDDRGFCLVLLTAVLLGKRMPHVSYTKPHKYFETLNIFMNKLFCGHPKMWCVTECKIR